MSGGSRRNTGKTLDETVENLREAVSLHLKGEDPADFGLVQDPSVLLTFDLELAGAQT
jgi:predicted RNase H-like HicB family nuclease